MNHVINKKYFGVKKEDFEKLITNFLIIILSFIETNVIFFLTEEIMDIINNFEAIKEKTLLGPDNSQEICVFDIEQEEFFDIAKIFEISKNGEVIHLPDGNFFVPNNIEHWVQDAKYGMEYLSDSLVE
ncbi:MAG: hypothetical protein PHO23_01420 [Candidatus Pacebacteria bacterium]|nr:hypothetical protein [Candidatus Paceibacterota bacterium]